VCDFESEENSIINNNNNNSEQQEGGKERKTATDWAIFFESVRSFALHFDLICFRIPNHP